MALILSFHANHKNQTNFNGWRRGRGFWDGLDLCHLDVEPGPCRASVPAWYFNRLTSRCEAFSYGGCSGNANRFHSQEQCERQCGSFRQQGLTTTTTTIFFFFFLLLLLLLFIISFNFTQEMAYQSMSILQFNLLHLILIGFL